MKLDYRKKSVLQAFWVVLELVTMIIKIIFLESPKNLSKYNLLIGGGEGGHNYC